jgi:hypothetical protein
VLSAAQWQSDGGGDHVGSYEEISTAGAESDHRERATGKDRGSDGAMFDAFRGSEDYWLSLVMLGGDDVR